MLDIQAVARHGNQLMSTALTTVGAGQSQALATLASNKEERGVNERLDALEDKQTSLTNEIGAISAGQRTMMEKLDRLLAFVDDDFQ